MLDIALLASNASQLKYVLQFGPIHEFYTLLIALITISIILQLVLGMLCVIVGSLDVNRNENQQPARFYNNIIVLLIFIISIINIVISAFSIKHTTGPLIMMRLEYLHKSGRGGSAWRQRNSN
ncbi:hypothetical protein O3G_MSEX008889 [Manduca sexta]|nr:hypothetical protein O3G_MSEX008889 [Manduca sexta]